MTDTVLNKNMRETILNQSILLFARVGFDAVSMRDIAAAVGVTPAALYHHFSDKEQLYLEAVSHACKEKMGTLMTAIEDEETPWARLEAFVKRFAELLSAEKDFQRLVQWSQLDSDEQRHRKLADNAFREIFVFVHNLAGELFQGHDSHLIAMSIIGLIFYPFETMNARRFLPGYQSHHEDPAILAQFVIDLLRKGLPA